jgi:hypothetical protein
MAARVPSKRKGRVLAMVCSGAGVWFLETLVDKFGSSMG